MAKEETGLIQAPKSVPGAILGPGGPLLVRKAGHDGAVIAAVRKVLLKEGQGLVAFGRGDKKKWELDAEGFRKLNQIAGLNVITPPTVIVDGQEQHNPYYERNKITKAVEMIYLRKIVMGLSPLGNMVVIDKTLVYSNYTYFVEALSAMIQRNPQAGVLGVAEERPKVFKHVPRKWNRDLWNGKGGYEYLEDEAEEVDAPKTLKFFHVEGTFGIWIDFTHSAVLELVTAHTQKQKFLSRAAETTILRLCLQEHPAIAAKKVEIEMVNKVAQALVPVFFHHTDMTLQQQADIAEAISEGRPIEGTEVRSSVVDEAETGREIHNDLESESEDAPKPVEDLSTDEFGDIMDSGKEDKDEDN